MDNGEFNNGGGGSAAADSGYSGSGSKGGGGRSMVKASFDGGHTTISRRAMRGREGGTKFARTDLTFFVEAGGSNAIGGQYYQ